MKTTGFLSVTIISIFLASTASPAAIIGDIVVAFDDSNDDNNITVTVSATPASLTPRFDFPMGPPKREDATVALRNVLSMNATGSTDIFEMTDEDGASDLVTFTTVANSKDVILTLNSDPLSEGSIPEAEKKPYGMADEATKTIPLPPGFPELSGAILTVRATSDSNPVPEPSSLMLMGSAIAVLGFAARRRPKSGARAVAEP